MPRRRRTSASPAAPRARTAIPDLDALLEHYRTALDDTVFTLPTTALSALRQLRELAGDRLLVLAADKSLSTEESLGYREEPEPARHSGAFSLMVNFHALGLYARRHGGELLHGGDRHEALDVGALVFGGGEADARGVRGRARAVRARRPGDADRGRRARGGRAARGASSSRCCG